MSSTNDPDMPLGEPDHLEARLLIEEPATPGHVLQKKLEDTSAGCRGRAADSLAAAAAMDTRNGRVRMETSAATWTARAELLQRLELRIEAREKAQPDGLETAPERS